MGTAVEDLAPGPVPNLPFAPTPPEKDAAIQDLARAIREAVDAEIDERAADLAATDDAHLVGDHESKARAIAHTIAAEAVERHLARKKRAGASAAGRWRAPARRRSAGG
ncbi:MAG TPA: hypothetical protein VG406_01375 [Isosphaeraceae bacterium]|jgi:hypothetical protein|nr:hypothetical protein [Isosphaeraceae bacterium]